VGTAGAPLDYTEPRLSHSGRRLAVVIRDATGNADIWIYDLSRGVATRLTFDPADDTAPVWSPDDSRIVFSSTRSLPENLYWKPSNGTGKEELLYKSADRCFADSWSSDGRLILFSAREPKTRWDEWAFSVSDRLAFPVVQTEFGDYLGQFSPDGQWIAYLSNQSGRWEVYVQRFPEPGGTWQVSNAGGRMLLWGPDGKEIFYAASDGKIMAVAVRASGSGFEADAARVLFERRMVGAPDRQFDVSADGRRFLLNVPVEEEKNTAPITLVQNWTARIGR
jgi:Tol biopolymer transport system component